MAHSGMGHLLNGVDHKQSIGQLGSVTKEALVERGLAPMGHWSNGVILPLFVTGCSD